jgi:hypothetical protein
MEDILQMAKVVSRAEVCKDDDCLFTNNKGADYGVRQLLKNSMGETYWYHHAWGITLPEDAQELADSINSKAYASGYEHDSHYYENIQYAQTT